MDRALAPLVPLADVAPPRSQGPGAVTVLLLLVGIGVVIGIVIAVVRSRRK